MLSRKNARRFAALIMLAGTLALVGCSDKKTDAPKTEGEPKAPTPGQTPPGSSQENPDKKKEQVQAQTDVQLHDAVAKKVDALKGLAYRDKSQSGNPVVRVLLGHTKVTDEDLAEFAKLQTITNMWINHTGVNDASMKVIASFKVLTELHLDDTKITNAGLKELVALQQLETLSLFGTAVTDAGLKELGALKNLTKLDVVGTEVTDAGVKELQNALPTCKIETKR